MIDKLQKIAELAPELCTERKVSAFAIPLGKGTLDTDKNGIPNQDTQWMLIGRLVESLVNQGVQVNLSTYHDVATGKLRNDAIIDSYFDHTHHEAPTLLEAVCDAWLALKGGE